MKRLLTFFSILLALSAGSVPAQNAWISTNLADFACFGTLNVSGGYDLSPHWDLEGGFRYNNWDFRRYGNYLQDKRRTVYAGARYWFTETCGGWWSSLRLQAEEYNRGGLFRKPLTEEGNAFGLSAGFGWSHPLHYGFRMDAGLFLWGGRTRYDSYSTPHCGRCLVEKGRKGFIRYDCAVVALVYDLNRKRRTRQQ